MAGRARADVWLVDGQTSSGRTVFFNSGRIALCAYQPTERAFEKGKELIEVLLKDFLDTRDCSALCPKSAQRMSQ
jgi:hypothetical protein